VVSPVRAELLSFRWPSRSSRNAHPPKGDSPRMPGFRCWCGRRCAGQTIATVDLDATVIESCKQEDQRVPPPRRQHSLAAAGGPCGAPATKQGSRWPLLSFEILVAIWAIDNPPNHGPVSNLSEAMAKRSDPRPDVRTPTTLPPLSAGSRTGWFGGAWRVLRGRLAGGRALGSIPGWIQ
jgi:hypothetical protein